MKVKDLVYIILDEIKSISDDSIITEDHVIFLIKRYRSFLIKKEKDKDKTTTDEDNDFEYQTICLDLEKVSAFGDLQCVGGYYLRSTKPIPQILEGTTPKLYPVDYYSGQNIVFVSRDRMRYVGKNKYLRNIIYASIGPDLHLYLTSSNPLFLYLKQINLSAIFEDYEGVLEMQCSSSDGACDVLDSSFPIREYLVPPLIELCVKELLGAQYRPADQINSASDDLANLISFIRRNTKSSLLKQIEDD